MDKRRTRPRFVQSFRGIENMIQSEYQSNFQGHLLHIAKEQVCYKCPKWLLTLDTASDMSVFQASSNGASTSSDPQSAAFGFSQSFRGNILITCSCPELMSRNYPTPTISCHGRWKSRVSPVFRMELTNLESFQHPSPQLAMAA